MGVRSAARRRRHCSRAPHLLVRACACERALRPLAYSNVVPSPFPSCLAAPPGHKVKLSFRIPYRTDYGQDIAMVGSTDLLGNWDPKRAMGMKWSEGDVWHVDFEVTPG